MILKTAAILVAAGSGKRMGADINKVYLNLNGRPVLSYSIETLAQSYNISEIIIAAKEGEELQGENLAELYGMGKVKAVVTGGETRSLSVLEALRAVSDDIELVAIHDGARPLLTEVDLDTVLKIAELGENDGAILAAPMVDTIKEAEDMTITTTIDRSKLWRAFTPQVFKKDFIIKAYEEVDDLGVTDDASVAETYGGKVAIVPGNTLNIKITTPMDLKMAAYFLDGGLI